MGIKLSDWAKLPGELRNQILQAAEEGGPEEYRTLIKKYFQKVAQKGSAAEEQP
jgi:TRAP-type C4-dicarboxylate transport system substrate-binding protein